MLFAIAAGRRCRTLTVGYAESGFQEVEQLHTAPARPALCFLGLQMHHSRCEDMLGITIDLRLNREGRRRQEDRTGGLGRGLRGDSVCELGRLLDPPVCPGVRWDGESAGSDDLLDRGTCQFVDGVDPRVSQTCGGMGSDSDNLS
jgi:hypothetical protein